MINERCAACTDGINAFNGRYCRPLKRSVEYAPEPPCEVNSE